MKITPRLQLDVYAEKPELRQLPTGEEKQAFLKSCGWTVGARDPRLNTDFPGAFMAVEPHEEHELPTRDGSNGPWCIVGDDLPKLIDQAYAFVTEMDNG